MKTQEEIVARIKERQKEDVLGFEAICYLDGLDFEHAKPFIKEEFWEKYKEKQPLDEAGIRKKMIDYMPFAWEKANNFRGISANRSIAHYQAWLWMLGEEKLAEEIDEDYEYYGKPQLRKICEFLGIDADQWDDGVRLNEEPI